MRKLHSLVSSILLTATVAMVCPAVSRATDSPNALTAGIAHLPIGTLDAEVTGLTVYGPTPEGVRVDVAFKGTILGRLQGTMEGIDYSTVRADGVTQLHVRGKLTTSDQALIAVEIDGLMANGKVSDTRVKFLTAAPQYAWLLDRIIIGKGYATTEKISVRYFLVD